MACKDTEATFNCGDIRGILDLSFQDFVGVYGKLYSAIHRCMHYFP